MKNIAILGSTGSIGTQTIEVVLDVVKEALGSPVEIEFAVDLNKDKDYKTSFYLLQIKPLIGNSHDYNIEPEELEKEAELLKNKNAEEKRKRLEKEAKEQYDEDIKNEYNPKDIIVEDADLFLGTKASTNTTVNYTAQGIANYLNINGKVSITGQMSFKFTEYSNLNKTISFPGGGGNNTPFASISQLIVSTIDLSGQQVEIFLAYLIDKEILLARQNEINSFGNYKITAYAVTTNPAFYTLDLEFIGGNGFILKDNYYPLSFIFKNCI